MQMYCGQELQFVSMSNAGTSCTAPPAAVHVAERTVLMFGLFHYRAYLLSTMLFLDLNAAFRPGHRLFLSP